MRLISQRLCMEKDLGIHGNLFGGIMLSWLDEAAATMAYEICHSPNMVTLKIEEVLFKRPVKIGFHLKIYGEVVGVGNTSITLSVEARKYNVYSGEELVVCSTNITFVRIDEQGGPVPISDEVKNQLTSLK
ncbi:MAG: acyl-CoA thioesterase [Flavobacteriales bacterium]|nr:acyl-CoA thioesterase [Flavobacteriales bacterium]NCG29556.1 acyl-CoA thioesterase [Bacteroidota bacterium]MBT3963940.1 acyl-CoA thioesterase [Flavobacteriales bacterium]MBT4704047.1 acyl-CoA thioesterase [Flavobacteriales bacterium]MBT4930257.1 acyl-CoA thioesterase [Flavobacteriales bacterium]